MSQFVSDSRAEREEVREEHMIRKAKMEDLPEMLRIYRAARAFMKKTGNPTQWVDPDGTERPTEEQLVQDIREEKSYVLETPEGLRAVFFYDEGEKIEATYDYIEGAWTGTEDYAVVHRIASDGQRRGAGRKCLRWAMERSGHVRIDTHENNRPMQHVLTSLGFGYCGIIYLENGDPRLAYEWTKERA